MAYSSKKDVQVFYELIKEGWQPTFNEITERFKLTKKDQLRRKLLTGLLIKRVRRMLKKKDDLYFYCVDKDTKADGTIVFKRKYKLLSASREYSEITNKLWRITDGFRKACGDVLVNGVEKYPNTLKPLLEGFKYKMELVAGMAKDMTLDLDDSLKKLEEGGKDEDSNQ